MTVIDDTLDSPFSLTSLVHGTGLALVKLDPSLAEFRSKPIVAFPNSKHGENGGAGYTGRLFRRRSHVQFSIQP